MWADRDLSLLFEIPADPSAYASRALWARRPSLLLTLHFSGVFVELWPQNFRALFGNSQTVMKAISLSTLKDCAQCKNKNTPSPTCSVWPILYKGMVASSP